MGKSNFITEEHKKRLPAIRITKAHLKDFKNVGEGTIKFNSGIDGEPDILGIYGQNGSGKTSFIEALSILERLMSGNVLKTRDPKEDLDFIGINYTDCIAEGKDHAQLTFEFELIYNDQNLVREAEYSFCLKSEKITEDDAKYSNNNIKQKIIVFNENFSLKDGDKKREKIIDTSLKNIISKPFIRQKSMPKPEELTSLRPITKLMNLVNDDYMDLVFLETNKVHAQGLSKDSFSRSFIFWDNTLSIFRNSNNHSEKNDINADGVKYFEVLAELNNYAKNKLFVLPTKPSGLIRLNYALPIFTTSKEYDFFSYQEIAVAKKEYKSVNDVIKNISLVLEQLVPGLSIELKKFAETKTEDGENAYNVMLVAKRGKTELPIRVESDGVRRTISIISLIIAAFNDPSTTVAIDEFDAGIYEYLLGEILQVFEDYGQGQFIFTSHNLRPLEVINKKYICFTTTKPNDRYFRIKNIAKTNNLRDTYFRAIMLDEQDQPLYNPTQRFKIITAFTKANGEA